MTDNNYVTPLHGLIHLYKAQGTRSQIASLRYIHVHKVYLRRDIFSFEKGKCICKSSDFFQLRLMKFLHDGDTAKCTSSKHEFSLVTNNRRPWCSKIAKGQFWRLIWSSWLKRGFNANIRVTASKSSPVQQWDKFNNVKVWLFCGQILSTMLGVKSKLARDN